MAGKHVTVVGGGVAGLSSALQLARFNVHVDVIEKSPFMGGHAIRFACKATDRCVKCGACIVEEKLKQALLSPGIRLLTGTRLENFQKKNRFSFDLHRSPHRVDPESCTGCGECREICPAGAVVKGSSFYHKPFYAIDQEKCLRSRGENCHACRDGCPEKAIHLDRQPSVETCETDAVIIATGFTPYHPDPENKPYGYKRFKNVSTNLELEEMLRNNGRVIQDSNIQDVRKIAFIQCVGSRDAGLGHLWCSRVCCGSSLRMARLIQSRQPEAEITIFYIDIQNFGKDFETYYASARKNIRFQRAIPGDIFQLEDGRLRMAFLDDASRGAREEIFDLVVLAIGLCPPQPVSGSGGALGVGLSQDGFIDPSETGEGVFAAGTATGPMGIAESAASADSAVWSAIQYLKKIRAANL